MVLPFNCSWPYDHILNSILNACHDEWEVKEVNANFMLGVKRDMKINEKEYSIELTMTAYVEGMVNAFKEYQRPKHVSTPFSEHTVGHISKFDEVSDEEIKEVLNRGYMRLVGMLL